MAGQLDLGKVVGSDGQGVPTGGSTGQMLRKKSTSDFDAEWADIKPVLVLNCGTISSLPTTITNTNITNDMVALQSTLGNPAAQLSDWTVTTSNGSVTISGTISGSTTLTMYLCKSR